MNLSETTTENKEKEMSGPDTEFSESVAPTGRRMADRHPIGGLLPFAVGPLTRPPSEVEEAFKRNQDEYLKLARDAATARRADLALSDKLNALRLLLDGAVKVLNDLEKDARK